MADLVEDNVVGIVESFDDLRLHGNLLRGIYSHGFGKSSAILLSPRFHAAGSTLQGKRNLLGFPSEVDECKGPKLLKDDFGISMLKLQELESGSVDDEITSTWLKEQLDSDGNGCVSMEEFEETLKHVRRQ